MESSQWENWDHLSCRKVLFIITSSMKMNSINIVAYTLNYLEKGHNRVDFFAGELLVLKVIR
jgi:hypothetical protein